MKDSIAITDQRMLQLMDWAVKNELVETEGEYWEKIGFTRTNLSNIKKGTQGFTRDHIRNACLFTGASADWILEIDKKMFRDSKHESPIQTVKRGLAQLEAELKGKSAKNGSPKKVKN